MFIQTQMFGEGRKCFGVAVRARFAAQVRGPTHAQITKAVAVYLCAYSTFSPPLCRYNVFFSLRASTISVQISRPN